MSKVQNGKEKVGICVQPLKLPLALSEEPMAMSIKMPLVFGGIDWRVSPEPQAEHGRGSGDLDLAGTASG